jgi:hypothetical protein
LARNVGPLLGIDEPVHGGRVLPNQPLVSISESKIEDKKTIKKKNYLKYHAQWVRRYGSGNIF